MDLSQFKHVHEDLGAFNRSIILLEQAYLRVLNGSQSLDKLYRDDALTDVWSFIDHNPYPAWCMARIKSGHAMTPRHGINVMMMARAWMVACHRLGQKLDLFSFACLVHDYGHWHPSDLVYVFGRYSFAQARQLATHCDASTWASEVLTDEARAWIANHHEQPDGKGYPQGQEDPGTLSQVIRIVDCFEGLTTARRIRPVYRYEDAAQLMRRWSGLKFPRGLLQSWLAFTGHIPVGSYVKKASGEIAVALPPANGEQKGLRLTNAQGDVRPDDAIDLCDLADVTPATHSWRQLALPTPWSWLRPDLLSLPRMIQDDEA